MKAPELFAVTGNPILHSLSPDMMNAALESAGDSAFYTRLHATSAGEVIESMLSLGIKGLNVTAPFKKALLPYVDHTDISVKYTGALNTIVRQQGTLVAYNTDFIGVVNTLKRMGYFLAGKKVLVIGAGGAAAAAVFGLRQNYAKVTVVNRTFSRAQKLATTFNSRAVPLQGLEREVHRAECIINTVADNRIPIDAEWLNPLQWIFDANYKNSQLLHDAQSVQAKIVPGQKWLFNQAVPAYYIFRGKQPHFKAMRSAFTAKQKEQQPKLVIYSDTQVDEQLLATIREKTGLEVQDGTRLDVFTERTINTLNYRYIKVLLFSDNYAGNKHEGAHNHEMLYFADLIIPRRLRKNIELSNLIYEEINKTFSI